jgi:hypothetical protein
MCLIGRCLRGFGGSKIGTRTPIQYRRNSLTLRDSLSVCLRHLGEFDQIDIIERFDPNQSVVGPRWMRQNKITNALDASRRQRAFIANDSTMVGSVMMICRSP